MRREIAGTQSGLALLERGEIAGRAVEAGGKAGRRARIHTLSEQRADHATEHVAHTAARHARIAVGAERDAIATRAGDERPRALEQRHGAGPRRERRDRGEAIDADLSGRDPEQARRLARMRRDHRTRRQGAIVGREQIERIGIDHQRASGREDAVEHLLAPGRLAEPRSDDDRCPLGEREDLGPRIDGPRHRLWGASEQRRHVLAPRRDAHESSTDPERSLGRQDRRAAETLISTDDQHVAESTLVRCARAPRQAARAFAEPEQLRFRIRPVRLEHLMRHAEIGEGEIAGVIGTDAREQSPLRGDEGDGGVRAHGDAERTARVGVEAARQIEGEHRATAVSDRVDRGRESRTDRTGDSGAEERVDDDVAAHRRFGVEGFDAHPSLQCPVAGARGIALEIGGIADLEDLYVHAAIERHAGHHVAVAGVVATATADREHLRIRPAIAQQFEGGRAGPAHEHDARQTEVVDGAAIERARGRSRVQGIDAGQGIAQHRREGIVFEHCRGFPFGRTLDCAILPPDPPTMDLQALANDIRTWGQELGFDAIGITDTDLGEHPAHLERWLEAGHAGTMDWMARHADLRSAPERLEPWTLRVISARMDYRPPDDDPLGTLEDGARAYVSRYALGRDYHKVIRPRLARLAERIEAHVGGRYRAFTDSAPVLEKALAENAGLGWIGKNTLLLSREAGSFFFLGEIFTDIPLPLDAPQTRDHCGSCSACMTACPTDAFVGPRQLDAKRCIAYLTIEHKGPIPEPLRAAMGNRVFGCDDCQLVCPWNKFSPVTREDDFHPRHGLEGSELCALFAWDEATFLERTQGSAIRRTGYDGWLRNLAVGLGNAPPDADTLALLEARRDSVSEMVREHVDWAIARQRAGLGTNASPKH